MKKIFILFLFSVRVSLAQTYSIISQPTNMQITCNNPTVFVSLNNGSGSSPSFTCQSNTFTSVGATVSITSPGNYTMKVNNSSSITNIPIAISANTVIPISTFSPTSMIVSQLNPAQVFTFIAVSPTVNITHIIYTPIYSTYTHSEVITYHIPGSLGTYTYCLKDNSNGCLSCKQFTLTDNATSLSETETQTNKSFSLFPNPTNDKIFINNLNKLPTIQEIEITNSFGQLVFKSEQVINSLEIGISTQSLVNGVYLLKLKFSNSTFSSKIFVVEK